MNWQDFLVEKTPVPSDELITILKDNPQLREELEGFLCAFALDVAKGAAMGRGEETIRAAAQYRVVVALMESMLRPIDGHKTKG